MNSTNHVPMCIVSIPIHPSALLVCVFRMKCNGLGIVTAPLTKTNAATFELVRFGSDRAQVSKPSSTTKVECRQDAPLGSEDL